MSDYSVVAQCGTGSDLKQEKILGNDVRRYQKRLAPMQVLKNSFMFDSGARGQK